MVKVDSNGMTKGERNQLQRKVLESSLRRDRAEYRKEYFIKEYYEEGEQIFYPDNEAYTYYPTHITYYDKYFRHHRIFNCANDGELFVLVTNRATPRESYEFYNPYEFKNYSDTEGGCKSAKMDYYRQLYQFDIMPKEGKDMKIRLIKKGHYIIELEHYSDIKKALNLTKKVNKFLLYDMIANKRHCVPLELSDGMKEKLGCEYIKTFRFEYGWNKDPLPIEMAMRDRQEKIDKKFNKLVKIRVINQ